MILDNGDGDVQTLLKGYSNSQGEINFDLSGLPTNIPLELHINRYQHWPVKFSFTYEVV